MRDYLLFIRKEYGFLGFGFLLFFWSNFGQSFFIAWFGVPIQESLGLSASGYSSAYSVATLGSAASIVIIGRFIDRVTLTRYLAFVGTGLILAMLLLANSAGYVSLLVAFFLLRLFGQGLLPHAGQTVMARNYDANRGKALSIASAGRPLGEVVLPSLILLTIAMMSWRTAWLFYATLGGVIFLPLLLLLSSRLPSFTDVRNSVDEGNSSKYGALLTRDYTLVEVLQDHNFWLILPVVLAAPLVTTGVFIHQGYLMIDKNWAAELFAFGFVLYGVMHWIAMLGVGVLIDRYSAVGVSRIFMVPLTLAVAALALFDGSWAIFAFMFLAGTSVGAMGPVVGAIWAEMYGVSHLGSIRSVIISMMVFATAVAPYSAGLAIDAGIPVERILIVVFFGMLIALITALVAYRRKIPIS